MSKKLKKKYATQMLASNEFETQLANQERITASNALDMALRLTPFDCWTYEQSLNPLNAYNNVSMNVITLQQMLLTYLYKTYGILAKVVDIPVDDAYKRGGFEINTDTLGEDETDKLEKELRKNQDIKVIKTAQKWARLFGGGAVIAIDGNNMSSALNPDRLECKELKFLAVDRWQLSYSNADVNIPGGTWELVNYNQNADGMRKIHPSRVFIVQGKDAPYIVARQVQGWGISVYEQIFQDMSQFFKSRNVLFELLDEAKTDILKLSSLQTALTSDVGERAVQRMVDMIAKNKNYKSQITLSSNDDYDQKQISFGGLAEILKEIRVMMAGSVNMPVNKLWGEGVTGFGSGEDSLENYNSQIENEIRTPAEPLIEWILKLRCYQLFGREVEDLDFEWKSLRVMNSIDEQNVKDKKFAEVMQMYDRQLLTPQEVMEYLKRQDIFIHDTKAIKGELEDMPLQTQDNFTEFRDKSET